MKLDQLASQLLDFAQHSGAQHADAVVVKSVGESIHVRHGRVESIEGEHAQGIGLRGFVDTSHGLAFASASTSDLSPQGLQTLAEQVVAMAKISEPDPDAVPPVGAHHPDKATLAAWENHHPHISHDWNTALAREVALACEAAALEFSKDVSNSEGASTSFGDSFTAYASSDGFMAEYAKSSASLSASVIAGSGEAMQRDYAWDRAFSASHLRDAQSLGQEAAARACARLGSQSVSSRSCPVLFEPRIAGSLMGHLISAINGRSVLQKRSFLAEAVGKTLFPTWFNLEENPDHPLGLANRLFDGEGTLCQPRQIIKHGQLTGFLSDRYAAKRLNILATGNASRGLTGDIGIGTSNLIVGGGEMSQAEILADIQNGFLVTELMGFGINGVTGDYSRGAAGFLIENGQLGQAVSEVTIAGNLSDMFQNISHLGNDLTWFGAVAVPSIVISNMTIAGQAS